MADIYHDLEQSPRPSRSNVDPFYAVKEELQNDVRLLTSDRESLVEIASRDDEPTDAELNRAARAVKSRCKRIEQQVKDLSRTIDQVEKQRSRFPNIDDKELFTRKKFISDVKAIARETRDELAKHTSASKNQASGKSAKKSSVAVNQDTPASSSAGGPRRVPVAQQMVEAEQEVHLDDMMSSLQRLGVMGQQVGEELEQQKVLLGNLDEDLDDTGNRMENVMRKLDKLIGTSNTGKLWIILFLTLLLILLIFCIVYL